MRESIRAPDAGVGPPPALDLIRSDLEHTPMIPAKLRSAALCLTTAVVASVTTLATQERSPSQTKEAREASVQLHYLEVVTPEMDKTCALLSKLHGVEFSEPQEALGNARTAKLGDGGKIGVRKPMHAAERSVVRPYALVDDIDAAFAKAEAAGAQIMMRPTPSAEGGRFSLFLLGGIEHAIWED